MIAAFALFLMPPDIRCELGGMYTGNAISPTYTLKIGGPPKREWAYTYGDDMFGQLKPRLAVEHRGTYEIDGDLAVFTGARADDPKRDVKFGLNFGFPNGKVAFDRLFPDGKGNFSYARKWFRKRGNEWQPAEERWLTVALPDEIPKNLELNWKGRRTRWDATGTRSEEALAAKVRYKPGVNGWHVPDGPNPAWLPGELIFEQSNRGKVVAITWGNRYIGDLNGFHPGAGTLPVR